MLHLGDITQLHVDQIPVVDIITGGSPCQDLSVAGKRSGLAGERSGLFMEQIRIVKEMRERDRRTGRSAWAIRPRFMVWENVPGAFSSNKGRDFQTVLTEIVKICEPDAPDVPLPEGGRWSKAGCLYSEMGDWSIAWRVHDAQFWGVPQRRKRISLVADFGGLAAPEVLFERKGVSWYSEPSGEAWEGVAGATGGGVDSTGWGWHNGTYYMDADIEADPTIRQQGDCIDSTYPTVARSLTQRYNGSPCIDQGPDVVVQNIDSVFCLQGSAGGAGTECYVISALNSNAMKSPNPHSGIYRADTSRTLDLNGESPACNQGGMMVLEAVQIECVGGNDIAQTLDASYYKGPGNRNGKEREVIAEVDCRNGTENPQINGTLQAKSTGGIGVNFQNVCRVWQTVRRLTPTECERLQGFPDGWTDIGEWIDSKGKKHKPADSPRYKALGNSIALPFWQWMARRICSQYERTATIGSLFDGIGGFPLVFQRSGAIPVWASEIEEFPIAVTKRHFQEKEG